MHYISTRGTAPKVDFKGALLAGLACDGGLYVPESIPQFSPQKIASLASLSYADLALEIMMPFVGESFSRADMKRMIDTAYSNFRHPAIAPLTQLSSRHFVLELFHGPTLAFKDFALQLVGQLLEHAIKDSGQHAVVLGATSGDTGSAAMAGCMGRAGLDIVILYPDGRTSDVQRRQMTTLGAKNIHALAVDGTFDDCQDMVKTLFADAAFREKTHLLAVNSINFARVLAQIVYYFYAALRLGTPAAELSFTVPTGNFGDIYAGYLARQMGLPIKKLIIASNRNDILARCVATGEYTMAGVNASLSPSMDIEISSNFERLLFDLFDRDGAKLAAAMADFRKTKTLKLTPSQHADFTRLFAAHAVDDKGTLACIKRTQAETGYLLDPHTAVGVATTEALQPQGITVTLATAHPAKFPEAVREATGITPALPPHMADLMQKAEKFTPMAHDLEELKSFITTL
ncbi:MAG: threonine synthase [Rickettsiales bacterium]